MIVKAANSLVSKGWKSPVEPGCAAFVSEVMKIAGVSLDGIDNPYWVPDIAKEARKRFGDIKKPFPGCLVIVDQTYDAVPPRGIGPEDTETHIGIYLGENKDGKGMVAHYSNGAPRIILLQQWKNIPVKYCSLVPDSENTQKIQIWGKQGRIAIKINGKIHEPKSMYIEFMM